MSVPLLSVVVPTRDRGPLLRQALVSVAQLARGGIDLEIVVVDASGRDGSVPGLAHEFGGRLIEAFGGNAASTRNAGMAAARGTFLLFLDDDDVLLPEHVRPQLDRLMAREELGGAFGQIRLTNFDLTGLSAPYPLAEEVGDDFFAFLLRQHQQIASLVVRTSARETVGTFDETLGSSEDWDWMLRLALRHELELVEVPGVLFRQRPFGASDRLDLMRLRYLRRVFWRNVRRAGPRRPSTRAIVRAFAHHVGFRASNLLRSSHVHAGAGDMAAARYALWGAMAASPPHVMLGLARQPGMVAVLMRAHLRR
jgi:glycosyltransferase involved in cell wall biosynthesis